MSAKVIAFKRPATPPPQPKAAPKRHLSEDFIRGFVHGALSRSSKLTP